MFATLAACRGSIFNMRCVFRGRGGVGVWESPGGWAAGGPHFLVDFPRDWICISLLGNVPAEVFTAKTLAGKRRRKLRQVIISIRHIESARFGRSWPELVDTGRNHPRVGRDRSKFAGIAPKNQTRPKLVDFAPSIVNFAGSWSTLPQTSLTSPEIGDIPKIDRVWFKL